MPAILQVDRDHALPVQVHRADEPVLVYNRYNSDGDVVVHWDGFPGREQKTLKPNEAQRLALKGTWHLSTTTHADIKLIGGGY